MNAVLIIGIVISVLLAVTTYISTNNFIFMAISLSISLLYFFFIARPMIKKHLLKISRYHECYTFINTFIVSLSIKQSIIGAYETSYQSMPESFKNINNGLVELQELEKLNYLRQYFRFHVYGLFLNTIDLWSEQGGDILDMSAYLINETRLIEEYIVESNRLGRKHLMEFAVLWLFSLAILVILRFALAQFYKQIINKIFFPFTVLTIIVFVLLTIHMAIIRLTKLEVRGWSDVQ